MRATSALPRATNGFAFSVPRHGDVSPAPEAIRRRNNAANAVRRTRTKAAPSVIRVKTPLRLSDTTTRSHDEQHHGVLSKELGERGITANAVAPGPVDTELFTKGKQQSEIDAITGRTPLGRLGQPDDIARIVSFLVGPDGGWINGQVIRANGGII